MRLCEVVRAIMDIYSGEESESRGLDAGGGFEGVVSGMFGREEGSDPYRTFSHLLLQARTPPFNLRRLCNPVSLLRDKTFSSVRLGTWPFPSF